MVVVVGLLGLAVYLVAQRKRGARADAPELGPVGWVRDVDWSVVRPLARAEVPRLVGHPAFVGGVGLTLLTLALATQRSSAGDEWVDISGGVALGLAPLGWLTIAAAQLLTTRPRRTGTDTLFASLPAPAPARTASLLVASVGPVAVATVLAVGCVAWRAQQGGILGSGPDLLEIAAGPLLVLGAGVVGVAIGRYLPHPVFAAAGVVAVILIQGRFGTPTSWPWNAEESSPIRMLAFLATPTSADAALEFRPAGWHVVYLLGLIAMMAVVALARSGMTRPLTGALAAALTVVAVAGVAQTRPVPAARAAAMVRFLEDPTARQQCVTRDSVQYCVGARGMRALPTWQARVGAARALVPVAFSGRALRVQERVPTVVGNGSCAPVAYPETLVASVARAIDPTKVWPANGAIHPGVDTWPCSDSSVHGFFFATQVGLWAVGLPPSPWGLDQRCRADGEARAALALWIGAVVSPQGKATLQRILDEAPGSSVLSFDGWNDPPMWGVQFAARDAQLALSLLERPRAQVATAVAEEWVRLREPGTRGDALAALFGIEGVSVPPAVEPQCR